MSVVLGACQSEEAEHASGASSIKAPARPAARAASTQPGKIELVEPRFVTSPAMYTANEEWLTFACELPDGQVNIGARKAVEMYWYSRYGLGNLLFRSGMGVHIVHNPLFKKHVAEDKGMPWFGKPDGSKTFFQHKLAQFVKRTGSDKAKGQFPPKGAYPIYLEFSSGVPSFLQPPDLNDLATLRWDPAKMDKSMSPSGWGQSMMKQVLWARDFFTSHKQVGGITYLGNGKDDGGNGFRGAALTAQAITKSFALKSALAYNPKTRKLGGVDPATYDPAQGPIYYPHKYAVRMAKNPMKGMPPMPERFEVTDTSSDLFDVASLLWAESEFYFFTDPTVKDGYDLVFGDPKWNPMADPKQLETWFKEGKALFPLGPHMLAKGLTAVNMKNLMALHFDSKHGTLVDRWTPESQRGNRVSTQNAGMAMVALANTVQRMHDVPMLMGGARKLLTAQAEFLLRRQAADGSIASSFRIETGGKVTADRGPRALVAQTFAIRGWLAAYHVTKSQELLDAAQRAYAFMENELWSDSAGVYRARANDSRSTYDGYAFGATLGALRELAIVQSGAKRRAIVGRLDRFFTNVGQKAGLQLSEIGPTGEPIPSLAERGKMMAQMQQLMAKDPAKAMKMKMKMADGDGDGVPKPPFVAGTKFGAAPVQRDSVTLDVK